MREIASKPTAYVNTELDYIFLMIKNKAKQGLYEFKTIFMGDVKQLMLELKEQGFALAVEPFGTNSVYVTVSWE